MYLRVCIYIYVCIYVSIYIYPCVYIHICMYVLCMYLYIYTHTHRYKIGNHINTERGAQQGSFRERWYTPIYTDMHRYIPKYNRQSQQFGARCSARLISISVSSTPSRYFCPFFSVFFLLLLFLLSPSSAPSRYFASFFSFRFFFLLFLLFACHVCPK